MPQYGISNIIVTIIIIIIIITIIVISINTNRPMECLFMDFEVGLQRQEAMK